MKERPLICSGPKVRYILGLKVGEEAQTRRIVRAPRWFVPPQDEEMRAGAILNEIPCPYGVPGDRLWVRETWGVLHPQYVADLEYEPTFYRADSIAAPSEDIWPSWRPSIHMPRSRSRINLELTEVRVQRLAEISEEDALAEGGWRYTECPVHKNPRASFRMLWDSINAKRGHGWDSNPWVWALTFKNL